MEVLDDWPLELTLGALDQAGVQIGLISAWSSPTGWMISNDEVAAAVEAAPDRLVGIGSVDLFDSMEAVREVRRCAERGFRGIRVLPWVWGLPPNDRRFYPVYAACVDQGLPFCTQIGHTGPLRSSEPGRPIPYLEDVLLDFPELTVVGGHVGQPWMDEVFSLLRKFPNFFVDTSAYKLTRLPPALIDFIRGSGRGRVLFGTNFPMLTPAACLQGLNDIGFDEETKTCFFESNARRVFSLTA